MIVVEVWTDGSGLATGGPAGWAAVLLAVDEHGEVLRTLELSGPIEYGTNNVAELTAVLRGLEAIERPAVVRVITDSEYVMKAYTDGWLAKWRRNGWRNSQRRPVKNRDLWETLDAEVRRHREVSWQHVKGHVAERRCACGWRGALKHRRCPSCDEATTRHDVFPFNARCDELAGRARLDLIERTAAA